MTTTVIGSALTRSLLTTGNRSPHRTMPRALGTAHYVGDQPEAASSWELALDGLWHDAPLGPLHTAAPPGTGLDLNAS